jgi:hypothetical protein
MVLKNSMHFFRKSCGCVVTAGFLAPVFIAPGCPEHDRKCDLLAEPVHAHSENPFDNPMIVLNSASASGSAPNASVGRIDTILSINSDSKAPQQYSVSWHEVDGAETQYTLWFDIDDLRLHLFEE